MGRDLTNTTPLLYLMASSMKPFKSIRVMFSQHLLGKCVEPFSLFFFALLEDLVYQLLVSTAGRTCFHILLVSSGLGCKISYLVISYLPKFPSYT